MMTSEEVERGWLGRFVRETEAVSEEVGRIMERDKILKMEPGRELDALVAEQLGATVEWREFRQGKEALCEPPLNGRYCPTCGYDGLWHEERVPLFSTDIAMAISLMEQARNQAGCRWRKWRFEFAECGPGGRDGWRVDLTHWPQAGVLRRVPGAWGETIAEAICKTFLLLALIDKEEGDNG